MLKKVLTVALIISVVAATAVAPASAQLLGDSSDDDDDPTPPIVTYGDQSIPSFVVTLDANATDDLQSWVNESDTRNLRMLDAETSVAEVSAPRWAVDQGLLAALSEPGTLIDALGTTNLEDLAFVESVGLNYQQDVPEPVTTPLNGSQFSPPERFFGLDTYDLPTRGIAFDGDANQTYMDESRAVLGADNVSVTGDETDRPLAVIDTGLNTLTGGAVFQDRVSPASKNMLTNETVAENGTSVLDDPNGHGTWAAAAAAGNYSGTTHDGIAKDAPILALKALNDEGSGDTAAIARAVRYAADQDASTISMSLGSPVYAEAIADAVQYARNEGSVVVAAAGNSATTRSPGVGTPADVEGVISVAATTGESPQRAERAYFSQYGGAQPSDGVITNTEDVDVAAPGFNTTAFVVTDSGTGEDETLSGTSMATPMVAAGVHLARAENPEWDVRETTDTVRDAARPIPNATTQEVGAGMFAVDYAVNGETPNTTQEGAMTDAAATRAEVYDSLSNARGGFLAGLTVAAPLGVAA